MIAVAIFPVFYLLFLNLNLFPALHLSFVLCSPFLLGLSAHWAFLDFDRKVRDIIFEDILSPSERYQNIQDNPEYNSVLPFRIMKINFCREYVEVLWCQTLVYLYFLHVERNMSVAFYICISAPSTIISLGNLAWTLSSLVPTAL